MNLGRVQAIISKAFADEEFRKRLLANPGEALAEFGLAEEEKEAILKVQGRLGLATDLGTFPVATQQWLEPPPEPPASK